MSPPSREVYAREFLVGDARLKKPENQLKELDDYRRALYLDAFWQRALLYFYGELLSVYSGVVPPVYQVLNLATVYSILHPTQQKAAACFLPLSGICRRGALHRHPPQRPYRPPHRRRHPPRPRRRAAFHLAPGRRRQRMAV